MRGLLYFQFGRQKNGNVTRGRFEISHGANREHSKLGVTRTTADRKNVRVMHKFYLADGRTIKSDCQLVNPILRLRVRQFRVELRGVCCIRKSVEVLQIRQFIF